MDTETNSEQVIPDKVWSFTTEVNHGATPDNIRQRLLDLTWREAAVLRATLLGTPNKKIAIDEGVCVRTVEMCRRSIRQKLGVGTWAQVVIYVCRAELTQP